MPEPPRGDQPPTIALPGVPLPQEPISSGTTADLPRSLHAFLGEAGNLDRAALLALVRADQRKRWKRGEQVLMETYLSRLPALATDEEAVLDLIYSEVVLRGELGDPAQVDEYLKRFPEYTVPLRRQFALNAILGSDSLLDLAGPAPDGPDTSVLSPPSPPKIVDRQGARPAPTRPTVPGFEILEELGRGGMGVVYKARQVALKRTVALKMILAGAHASAADLTRIRAEAEVVARLQHLNIVQIYEIGEHEGLPYLALEYVDGGSLAQRLAGNPLAPAQAAQLIERLARAIQYAHEQGVVHRDLKPANILLPAVVESPRSEKRSTIRIGIRATEGLVPKVTDFGLAKQLQDDAGPTRSGAIVGTPSYMAPEQAGGKRKLIGPLSDVYALGAILYELLTGRPPFKAATAVDTVLQVLTEEPIPPARLNPTMPRDLETICLKCLEKQSHRRYDSAAALADDLLCYLERRPIAARPVSFTERAVKWMRRRPAVAALLGVAALLFVVGFALVTWQWQRAESALDDKSRALADKETALGAEARANQEKGAALRDSEANLYYNRIALADREWAANNVAGVEALLAHYDGPRCGWEWHYLKRLCHAELFTLPGEDCVAFSPDGQMLAAATDGGQNIRLWRWATQQVVRTLEGHRNRVHSLAFSPNGKHLASASEDHTARIWDLSTGRSLHVLTVDDGPLLQVAYNRDGTRLAAAGSDVVAVWDTDSGKELHRLAGHSGVAFSPDGTLLATPAGDKTIQLWDPATGTEVRTLGGSRSHTQRVTTVAFSPDGAHLASGSDDQTVRLWDPATGRELRTLRGQSGRIARVAFSPDSQRVAAIGGDLVVPGAVKVWDVDSGGEEHTYRWPARHGSDLAFHPDGRLLASADDHGVQLWDATNDPAARTCRGHTACVTSATFNPKGSQVASGDTDGTVRVWDPASGKQLLACRGHFDGVNAVAFAPDGSYLASASDDKTILFWDPATGKELRTLQHRAPVAALAFAPGGKLLAAASWDAEEPGEVRIWDPTAGEVRRTIRAEHITSLTFSEDGTRLAGLDREQNTVHVWDTANGQKTLTIQASPPASGGSAPPLVGVVFSPDGSRLVTVGGPLKTGEAKIWDARTGEALLKIAGPLGRVSAAAFSTDGRRLALGSWDRTVRLCDAQTGRTILTLRGHGDVVTGITFSPDGRRLASASADKSVKVWDATPLPPPSSPVGPR